MDAANQFGRGTPAGNAIYRLYHKKSMDSTLDPDLLARVQKMRKEREALEAAETKMKAIPKSQTAVNVPKFGRRGPKLTEEQLALAKLEAMGHRKREDQIRVDVAAEPVPAPPLPTKPLINEAEKDKLVQIFQFGEVLPPVANVPRRRAPTEEEKLEARFDELSLLLQEKKAYLQDVKSGLVGGKTAPDRRQTELLTTNEIARCIVEMKEIDSHLRELHSSSGRT